MRKKRTKSLNKTLVMLLLVGFSAALVLLVTLDSYAIRTYQNQKRDALDAVLNEQADTISHDLKDITSDAISIYAANGDFDILRKEEDKVETYTAASELNRMLYGLMGSKEQLHGYIIFYNGIEDFQSFYESDELEYRDLAAVRALLQDKLKSRGNGRKWEYVYLNGKNFALCSMKKGMAAIVMICLLDPKLRKIEGQYPQNNCFFMQETANGQKQYQVLGEQENAEVYETALTERPEGSLEYNARVKREYFSAVYVEDAHLWLVSAAGLTIWMYLDIAQMIMLAVTLFACVLVIGIYYRFRQGVIKPLAELVAEMNEIKSGNLDHSIHVDSEYEEISMVSVTLNQMVREVEHQKDITYQQMIEKQKAQMQFLSMQLKPHFYLNGLKTLNAFAMNGDREGVQDVIMRLSYHMRYILQLEKDMVLLRDEMDYVNNYIELQKEMTDRPIRLNWSVAADEAHWRVPALCIQTFVENSCKYARVGNAALPLNIRITIDELETEDGRFLDINVCDNGNGYPEQMLNVINGDLTEHTASVGINNLKRRCRILYGNWAEYNFYNDGGAVSELILPEKIQGEEHEHTDRG